MSKTIMTLKTFIPKPVFKLLSPVYHRLLAFFGASIYGFPSLGLKVIGVTGTSGKTTTVEFLHAVFAEAGFKVASLSSLRFKILDNEYPNMLKMTMPGRLRVQEFLREARNAGAEYVFLEVTSEGIKQYRHKFVKFYAAVFTNLSEEHLESHGGFENYKKAKGELFKVAPIHILNGDDPNFNFFYEIPAAKKVVYKSKDYPRGLKLRLAGDFNESNALAALTFARSEGIDDTISKRALLKINFVPGRMEFVETNKGFDVLVDYAFLPQTLSKVYENLSGQYKNLVCVIGATGGGRDKKKRPIIGDIADNFCKKVFVTNEDPYDEDPLNIIHEVAGKHKFEKILDRRKAIKKALTSAKKGDVVVVTGKGAEPWIMGPRGSMTAWDDRVVVKEELKKL